MTLMWENNLEAIRWFVAIVIVGIYLLLRNLAIGKFWSARHLAKVLEYSEYRHFLPVIEKAKEACAKSGQTINDHIEEFLDMIELGKGAERKVESIALSRYACYLVVQNADPSKKIVAMGQTYFAVQTRKQELAANLFRATQTEEKIRRENIQGKNKANKAHFEVGKKVRETINELGGTMPEDLPTPESILHIKKSKSKRLK